MKRLDEKFTSCGFNFEIVQRVGNVAIYRKTLKQGGTPGFEVIRIKSHNGFKMGGMTEKSEPAEYYPSNESWGTDGFTYTDLESAIAKFKELLKQNEIRTSNTQKR